MGLWSEEENFEEGALQVDQQEQSEELEDKKRLVELAKLSAEGESKVGSPLRCAMKDQYPERRKG